MKRSRARKPTPPATIHNPIAYVEQAVLDKPVKTDPPLRIPVKNPDLASDAHRARLALGLSISAFVSPEEHNASIAARYGRYKPEDRRTWPLNREEVARLYGEEAMLRIFPNP